MRTRFSPLWCLALISSLGLGCSDDDGDGEIIISYNEYSSVPSIGRGTGTSTDPRDPGYGAMRFFIEKVKEYTDDQGDDALPPGQQVTFVPDQSVGREINALRAGIDFANKNGDGNRRTTWGFIYNSWPFGIRFDQMVDFLYEAEIEIDGFSGNGRELAQFVLDRRGGTQVVFPVIGGTEQVSGYFPQPIGTPDCNEGDDECAGQGDGIGIEGICTSGWRLRYLNEPEEVLDRACSLLVDRNVIDEQTLTFFPSVGGQSVLIPMQRRIIQGFEFTVPSDDFIEFFPIKEATPESPLGDPDAGDLDCSPALPFPVPEGEATEPNCSQNIGQVGGRYVHSPGWHQPYLMAWMHIDKDIWNGLTDGQRAAIERAAREALVESHTATDSIQCERLQNILDINQGIDQREVDGTPQTVSAAMILSTWPQDALDVLLDARDELMADREGPEDPSAKSDEQQDFTDIWGAVQEYVASIGAEQFDPPTFPGSVGLAPGEECTLVR